MSIIWLMVLGALGFAPELPGGPDGFGYRWIRSVDAGGPSFAWIDATTGQMIALGDDQTRWVSVPFSFWFYNEQFSDSIAISSNGWVSFTTGVPNSPPLSWPDRVFEAALSVFGTDLAPDTVYLLQHNGKLVIEWLNAELVAGGGRYTFEVVIDPSDSSLTFQYLSHQGADWTAYGYSFVGIQNRDVSYSLTVSSALLRDSLAIKFYYQPEHDLSVSLVYPGDGFLLLDDGDDSVSFFVENHGITTAIDVPVICSITEGGQTVFLDTVVLSELPVDGHFYGKFTGWHRVAGHVFDISVSIDTFADPVWENNMAVLTQRVGSSAQDTLEVFSGGVEGGVWFSSQFQSFGVEFTPDTVPFLLRYMGAWLISEGDPGWPEPDTTIDPAVIEVWIGDSLPRTPIWADTVWRDNLYPGWVYSVLPDSIIVWNDHFWVVVRTRVSSRYGIEALAYDSSLDFPDIQWIQNRDGSWTKSTFASGDPMVFVSGDPVDLQFRGDIALEYLYPAWSHLIAAGEEDSVIVRVENRGPYSVSDITLSCILRDTEDVVVVDTIHIASLSTGDADSFDFGPFTIPSEFDSLMLSCSVFSSQDSILSNNQFYAVLRAVSPVNDTVEFGDPPPTSYFVPSDTSQRIAVSLVVDTPRSFLKYFAVWLGTPGDPCWPPEDTTIEPVVIEIWKGDSLPNQILFRDSVMRDAQQPGWVYWVPPESISLYDNIWVALQLSIDPHSSEALALDASYDHPELVWMKSDSGWTNSPQLEGDPIIVVFRDVSGSFIEEGSSAQVLRDGFVGKLPGIAGRTLPINFTISRNRRVILRIYDVLGREVRTLIDGQVDAGEHSVSWDLTNHDGSKVPDGVYFLVLQVGDTMDTRKFIVLKH